jgi:hypothetical protein
MSTAVSGQCSCRIRFGKGGDQIAKLGLIPKLEGVNAKSTPSKDFDVPVNELELLIVSIYVLVRSTLTNQVLSRQLVTSYSEWSNHKTKFKYFGLWTLGPGS